MVALKGVPALLSPELLYALARMGHGDEIGRDLALPTSPPGFQPCRLTAAGGGGGAQPADLRPLVATIWRRDWVGGWAAPTPRPGIGADHALSSRLFSSCGLELPGLLHLPVWAPGDPCRRPGHPAAPGGPAEAAPPGHLCGESGCSHGAGAQRQGEGPADPGVDGVRVHPTQGRLHESPGKVREV
ncbi:hypothetical protein H8957_004796 [Semnopithecus entellus]